MTAQTRTTNKNRFEQGDTPQGSDYVDLIDSFLSLSDTTAQTVVSQVTFSGGANIAAVSGADGYFDNLHDVSANTVGASTVSGAVVIANELFAVAASAKTFVCTSAMVRTGLGIGTAAPAVGLFIASSSEAALTFDVTTTTKASGGTGGAVPTSAQGFLIVNINGAKFYVPFFNVK